MPRQFLVTAALPYSNGRLHVGHIAGAYLPADIFVRFLRAGRRRAVRLRQRRQRRGDHDHRRQRKLHSRRGRRQVPQSTGTGLRKPRNRLRRLRRNSHARLRRTPQRDQPGVLPRDLRQGILHQADHQTAFRRSGRKVSSRPIRPGNLLLCGLQHPRAPTAINAKTAADRWTRFCSKTPRAC